MSPLVIDFIPHQRLREPNVDEVTTKESEGSLYERTDDQKDYLLLINAT
jgi:hypothetical protein